MGRIEKDTLVLQILQTLLFEIYKDGEMEKSEAEILEKFITVFKIPKDILQELSLRVCEESSRSLVNEKFDPVCFFSKIRGPLLQVYSKEQADETMQKIASLLGYPLNLDDFSHSTGSLKQDLQSKDIKIRALATSRLIAKGSLEYLGILKSQRDLETDTQLRYELSKSITALEKRQNTGLRDVNRLREALRSNDMDLLRRSVFYITKHRLVELLDETLILEKKTNDNYIKNCNLRLIPCAGVSHWQKLIHYLEDSDPRVVASAIEALSSLNTSEWIDVLKPFCKHANNRIRANAILALWRHGEEDFLAVEIMVRSSHSAFRDSALWLMEEILDPRFYPLLEILEKDTQQGLSQKAIICIDKMKKSGKKPLSIPKVIPEAASENLSSESSELSLQAKSDVVQNKNQPMEGGESKIPLSDEDLQKLGMKKTTPSPLAKIPFPELFSFLKSIQDDQELAKHLKEILRIPGGAREKIQMARFFSTHIHERVRANAIEVLSQLLEPKDFVIFEGFLKDPSNRVRGNAIIALGKHEKIRSAWLGKIHSSILELAWSKDENANKTAIFCIETLAFGELSGILVHLMESDQEEISTYASKTLERLSVVTEPYTKMFQMYLRNEKKFFTRYGKKTQKTPFVIPSKLKKAGLLVFGVLSVFILCGTIWVFWSML